MAFELKSFAGNIGDMHSARLAQSEAVSRGQVITGATNAFATALGQFRNAQQVRSNAESLANQVEKDRPDLANMIRERARLYRPNYFDPSADKENAANLRNTFAAQIATADSQRKRKLEDADRLIAAEDRAFQRGRQIASDGRASARFGMDKQLFKLKMQQAQEEILQKARDGQILNERESEFMANPNEDSYFNWLSAKVDSGGATAEERNIFNRIAADRGGIDTSTIFGSTSSTGSAGSVTTKQLSDARGEAVATKLALDNAERMYGKDSEEYANAEVDYVRSLTVLESLSPGEGRAALPQGDASSTERSLYESITGKSATQDGGVPGGLGADVTSAVGGGSPVQTRTDTQQVAPPPAPPVYRSRGNNRDSTRLKDLTDPFFHSGQGRGRR